MAKIGFVGLGHMGLPMALNLLKAGHEVTGFDLQTSALETLVKAGGYAADKLRDAALDKDVFFTMLQNGDQVQQVCLGEHGLYKAANRALHIDCSSIDVGVSQELHKQAASHHLLIVDAPVSGGVAGATAATLTIMVGGQKYAFEKAQPYLQQLGKKVIYAGSAGNGQAAKICNNMILGISMIAVSEAFVLAEQLGLSAEKLFEVVNNASGQCWVTTNYPPVPGLLPNAPASHDYQPGFSAAMMLKDLNLSQQSAARANVHSPMTERATLLYQQLVDAGKGDLDFSAIIKSLVPVKESYAP